MFMTIGLKLASLLAGGGITSLIGQFTDVYKAKLANGENQDKLSADLAGRELVLQQREAELQASLAKGEPGYVRQLFAYPPAIYLAKIFVWDKVFRMGVTDPLDDRLFWVMQTIIISYFGGRTLVDVVRQFRAK